MDAAGPLILTALLAAAALLVPTPRARSAAMLAALVLDVVVAVARVGGSEQLAPLRDHPAGAGGGALALAAVVAALAVAFDRRPAWLLPAAIVALPVRVPIAAGPTTTDVLAGLYVVVAAGVLAYAVPRLAGRERPDHGRGAGVLECALAAFVVLYAVRAAGSPGADRAVESAALAFVPGALLFVVVGRVLWTSWLTRACLATAIGLALALVALGGVEFAMGRLLLHPEVVALDRAGAVFRVQSLFFDPGLYGRFLAVVAVLVAAWLLWARGMRAAATATAVLVVLWAGLLLTFSESSLAALLAGLAVLGALRFGVRPALALSLLAVAIAGAAVALAPRTVDVDLGGSRPADRVLRDRYELVADGARVARDAPLLGEGSGAFVGTFRRAEGGSARRAVDASRATPVAVAVEQGVGGLALYLLLAGAALARLLRRARRAPARAAVGAAFAAVVAHTLVYGAFLADPLTWMLLAAGTAMTLRPPPVRRAVATPAEPERELVAV
jgi:O-antigen ligase/polysaccharide polymerase Wzy-like membrane protein